MIGVAVGDAVGLSREGLRRRVALKMFGRPKLVYRMLPGVGVYSDDTHLMLMAAQAILRSHSEWRSFSRSYLKRLAWYPLSLPAGAGRATLLAALKSWLRFTGLPTGCNSAGNGPATRAMFSNSSVEMATDHRIAKWVEDSTRITPHQFSCKPMAASCSRDLRKLRGTTRVKTHRSFLTRLQQSIAVSKEAVLRDKLSQLKPFLEASRSPKCRSKTLWLVQRD